ncbi:redoxin domain-containing protein [Pseudotenacibaculum haliotis]|uniref:Redoxin domain-containing protein n=1 Tax=Pseudotenacibaculum haliotis TaxID=1862138 RepID=A0ABW5LPU3_9FLAO
MRKVISFLIISFFILISCKKEIQRKEVYEIIGVVKNSRNNSIVQLQSNNKIIDTARIQNERFLFTGTIREPINVEIIVEGKEGFKSFWLENSKIQLISETENLKQAIIKGSKTQKLQEKFLLRVDKFDDFQDSLKVLLKDRSLSDKQREFLLKLKEKARIDELNVTIDFIEDFPNTLIGSSTLNDWKILIKEAYGKEMIEKLFSNMSIETKNSKVGSEISHFIEVSRDLNIGDKFVDIKLKNIHNKEISLSDVKATFTLIEFWTSWCAPCRKSNPHLISLYKKYHLNGFEIFGVSIDVFKRSWLNAVKKDGLLWENVIDTKGLESDVAFTYGVTELPSNVLIDNEGTIIARNLRGEKLEQKLKELFNERE